MTEQEQQDADDAYHERWMAQYGFVPPPDPEHPVTKKFWELEAAYYEWREAFLVASFEFRVGGPIRQGRA